MDKSQVGMTEEGFLGNERPIRPNTCIYAVRTFKDETVKVQFQRTWNVKIFVQTYIYVFEVSIIEMILFSIHGNGWACHVRIALYWD